MYYTYDQNNSGGHFILNDRVTYTVIVEAKSAAEADEKAEDHGIYFNGCNDGRDCPCCGDRWHKQWGEGSKTPEIYGKHPKEHKDVMCKKGEVYCYIYHADGTKETFIKE